MAFHGGDVAERLSDSELSICLDWYSIARSLSSHSLLRSPLTMKPPPARANREPMRRSSRCPKSETLGTAQLIRCPAETSPRSPGNQGFPVERSNGAASRLRSDRSRRPWPDWRMTVSGCSLLACMKRRGRHFNPAAWKLHPELIAWPNAFRVIKRSLDVIGIMERTGALRTSDCETPCLPRSCR